MAPAYASLEEARGVVEVIGVVLVITKYLFPQRNGQGSKVPS